MFRIAQRYKDKSRLDLLGTLEEGCCTIRLITPRDLKLYGLDSEVTFEIPDNHDDGSRHSALDYLFGKVQEKFERLAGLRHRDRAFYFANF